MAPFLPVESRADADAMLAASHERPVYLLKHSTTCLVSARGQQAVAALADASDVPLYRVVVQSARDVSTALADTLGVRHETPQALLLAHGRAVAFFNHSEIRTDVLADALSAASPSAAA